MSIISAQGDQCSLTHNKRNVNYFEPILFPILLFCSVKKKENDMKKKQTRSTELDKNQLVSTKNE